MTITQIVEVPADHRLVIEVPREIPAGPVELTFTPAAAREPAEARLTAEEEDAVELAFQSLDAFEGDLKRAAPEEITIMRGTVVTFNMADAAAKRPAREGPGV